MAYINRRKNKLTSFIFLIRFISGTSWGTTVSLLLYPYQTLFVGFLSYSLPAFTGTRRANMKILTRLQARAFCASVGLPRSASTSDTIAESYQLPINVLQVWHVLRVHLGHVACHANHHLTDIPAIRDASSFGKLVKTHQHLLPKDLVDMKDQHMPPWFLPQLDVSATIPGMFKKSDTPTTLLYQCRIMHIFGSHGSHAHIYTDGSTFNSGLAALFAFPAEVTVMNYKLSHRTSLTAAGLIAKQKALEFIYTKSPTSWTIFSNSKVALQALQSVSRRGIYLCLVYDILLLFGELLKSGHTLCFQWVPATAAFQATTQQMKP